MTSSKLKALLFVAIAFFVCIPLLTFAAVELQDTDINVDTLPENPRPYTDVTITLSSYAADLSKALIEWQSGNKTILSGYGKTTYSFKTLGPNSPTVFTVTITTQTKQVTKNILINPSEVDMLWQAVGGYTPPFYRGKSFASSEGTIKVVAMPNTKGTRASRSKLSYTWQSGDSTQLPSSGYGKDSYVFQNNNLNTTETISVTASSVDNTYSGSGTITIPIVDPQVIFYKKSPTDGILYNVALGNETTMTEDEMTVVAEPYFLNWNHTPSFSYVWKVNNETITTPTKKTELTIRPTSRDGYATIALTIENLQKLFQKASGRLQINL